MFCHQQRVHAKKNVIRSTAFWFQVHARTVPFSRKFIKWVTAHTFFSQMNDGAHIFYPIVSTLKLKWMTARTFSILCCTVDSKMSDGAHLFSYEWRRAHPVRFVESEMSDGARKFSIKWVTARTFSQMSDCALILYSWLKVKWVTARENFLKWVTACTGHFSSCTVLYVESEMSDGAQIFFSKEWRRADFFLKWVTARHIHNLHVQCNFEMIHKFTIYCR